MGNSCNRGAGGGGGGGGGGGDDSRGPFSAAWTSWRLAVSQDQAQTTFKKMGCLYCLAFFIFGKFACLALLFALPSVMIGMGAFYLHDCPRAPIIPIFLIVLGCYGIVETIIYGLRTCVFCDRCEIPLFVWEFSKGLIFGFFTWGSIGIFEIYEPNYDPRLGKYCDKALYLFAFSVVTILWIFLVLFLLMCLLMVLMLACGKDDIVDEEPRQDFDSRRQILIPRQDFNSWRQEPRQEVDSKRQEPRQEVDPRRSQEVKKVVI